MKIKRPPIRSTSFSLSKFKQGDVVENSGGNLYMVIVDVGSNYSHKSLVHLATGLRYTGTYEDTLFKLVKGSFVTEE